eukprot:1628385-Rhodomonas_salina.1
MSTYTAAASRVADDAGEAERLGWLVVMGRLLKSHGVIGLPLIKWCEGDSGEQPAAHGKPADGQPLTISASREQSVVQRIGFLFE